MNGSINGRDAPFSTIILAIWMVLMCFAVAFSYLSTTEELSPVYDTMVEAAEIADDAMEAIKEEKISRGIPISEDDILQTGMIGESYTTITTTMGVLEAKRTSTDPNWAAVVVGMFRRANLQPGDQVAMVFSGSFPALNICVMAAAQAYGLEQCIMASVGSSSYGANNEQFTFFDMAEFLYEKGILTHRLDLVSLGGASDVGNDFLDESVKNDIIGRIRQSGIAYLYEDDYEKNIDYRLWFIKERTPNIRFMINVGGSLVGLGTGMNAFVQTGYVEPRIHYSNDYITWGKRDSNCGLLQYFLAQGLPVASLLNIRGLALTYGVTYDPTERPQVGVGQMYYTTTYSPVIPIIALVLSVGVGVFYYLFKRYRGSEGRKDEKNYILC